MSHSNCRHSGICEQRALLGKPLHFTSLSTLGVFPLRSVPSARWVLCARGGRRTRQPYLRLSALSPGQARACVGPVGLPFPLVYSSEPSLVCSSRAELPPSTFLLSFIKGPFIATL